LLAPFLLETLPFLAGFLIIYPQLMAGKCGQNGVFPGGAPCVVWRKLVTIFDINGLCG
jgi:hypothetical protein